MPIYKSFFFLQLYVERFGLPGSFLQSLGNSCRISYDVLRKTELCSGFCALDLETTACSIDATVPDRVRDQFAMRFLARDLQSRAAEFPPQLGCQIARPQHNIEQSGAVQVVQGQRAQGDFKRAPRTLFERAHRPGQASGTVRRQGSAFGVFEQLVASAAKVVEAEIFPAERRHRWFRASGPAARHPWLRHRTLIPFTPRRAKRNDGPSRNNDFHFFFLRELEAEPGVSEATPLPVPAR
jgi:hypothetical protein